MERKKIPNDILYAWGISEFGFDDSKNDLIASIIYQEKMLYFLDGMFPDEPDHLENGFRPEKLEWCKKMKQLCEPTCWNISFSLILTMNIVQFINPAPFTSVFTNESPGRVGMWIGWQIVRNYMNRNSSVSLQQLMDNNDYQKILNQSGYSQE